MSNFTSLEENWGCLLSTDIAEGNFHADTLDFESLQRGTEVRGYLYELEHSVEDLRRVEEDAEAAAAAAAERQAQPVGEDDDPEPTRAGVNRWC